MAVLASACACGASRRVTCAGTPVHMASVTMESATVGRAVDRHGGGQLVHTAYGGRPPNNPPFRLCRPTTR